MRLKDKIVFVTGGSRGIGKAIVISCLKEGAKVHYLSTSPSPHQSEMDEVAANAGGQVVWHQGNVTDEAGIVSLIEEITKEGLDVVINNAGITRDTLSFRMKVEQWQQVIDVNLTGAFYVAREAARFMIRQRSGSIINMASVVGLTGNAGQVNYAASKAGLIGFTKSLAKECAARGVRVNAIAPGFIETDMTDELSDKIKEQILTQIPMGKMGQAEEVAEAVLFLSTDSSRYITGQVLTVDGGMVM
ncbi:MAG: 3-oxoacyl-[acyl-carrier-protein] reductase [Spirochaetaceae bacterium]|jgi:3-oxoacyl-[acyl-carrier protein] reductase|nr:3-oxoacyl-[acyl-carrier-protein] reductase [Spirochaetaceae bacterium]